MKYLLSVVIIFNAFFFNSNAIANETETESDFDWVTSIGTGGLVFRNILSDKHNLFFGLRYSNSKYKSTNYSDTNQYIDVEIGHRYYYNKSSINTFLDSSLNLGYAIRSRSSDDTKYYDLNFLFGVEKFISKEVSIEGSAGVSLSYSDYNDANSSGVYGPVTRVAVNYYF